MFFYTIGRVVEKPAARIGKNGTQYTTVKLELFGGMVAYAFVNNTHETLLNSFVGVKISPRADGNATYTICTLNDDAKKFITSASGYIDMHSEHTRKPIVSPARFYDVDDDDELPF